MRTTIEKQRSIASTADLEGLRCFRVVATLQSFTKGAAALRMDKSRVSRVVSLLEASLDTTLLVRTTRSVRLTNEGQTLLERIGPLLDGLEQAVSLTPDRGSAPSGEVVLTTTPDLGREWLAPRLVSFRARHPQVHVKVLLGVDVKDLAREGVDLALRVGHPKRSGLVARNVGTIEMAFFAAPQYLDRRGVPSKLEQLSEHEGLWPMPASNKTWLGTKSGGRAPAVECSEFGLLAQVARSGGGIALLPTFMASREVAAGNLVRVLPQVSMGEAPLHLLSLPVRSLAPRVAALRSFLLEARTQL